MKKYLIAGSLILIVVGYLFWSSSSSTESSEVFPTEGIEQIEINMEEWDVQIVQSKEPTVKVFAEGLGQTGSVRAKVEEGVLQVSQVTFEKGLFDGFSVKNNQKMKIVLPERYPNNLKIVTKSGDIQLDKISLINLSATSTSGDIYLQKIETKDCKKLKCLTDSGDIDVSFKSEPTNLRLNTSAKELNNELGISKFGKGEKQLDLVSPNGTISIF